jgi:uncharacterized membrane protein
MRPIIQFVKTTLIGGILVLIPLAIGMVFLRHAFDFSRRIAAPLAGFLPIDRLAGVVVADLLAGMVLLFVAFLLGLMARTRLGTHLTKQLERVVSSRIPGFTLFKNIEAVAAERRIYVVLIPSGDRYTLGFVMDRLDNGLLLRFLPSAPSATSGSICFMEAERVQRIDMKVTDAIACIMQLGSSAGEFFSGRWPLAPDKLSP